MKNLIITPKELKISILGVSHATYQRLIGSGQFDSAIFKLPSSNPNPRRSKNKFSLRKVSRILGYDYAELEGAVLNYRELIEKKGANYHGCSR